MVMPDGAREHPEFFDGSVLRWARVAGLDLGEVVYPPGKERPVHAHDRACFHYLLEGGYVEQHGRRSNECTTNTLAFQPAGHEHSYRACSSSDSSRSFTIELDDAWTSRLREHGVLLGDPVSQRGEAACWLQSRLYREFCSMDAASPLAIEALVLEMAVETSRHGRRLDDAAAGRKPPPWLAQATDLLHDHLADTPSLTEIARSVGVHPVHLARVFRRHHRCTVGEYVRGLRVGFACRELAHSSASLSEIALAAGFPDQSHFSRVFKRVTGLTPGAFRAGTRAR
jgi:AraC family transcriptional regulator